MFNEYEIEDNSQVVNVGGPKQTTESNENYNPMEIEKGHADEIREDMQDPRLDHIYQVQNSKPGTSGPTKKGEVKGLKKRYTKSARLTDSIKNNKKFLEISQKGIVSTDTYRETKLQLLKKHYETKANYYQQKIEALKSKENCNERIINILTNISNAVNKIVPVTK
ncbi:unnamed protein product [Brassicogethes aeneus]|uniref:Uncharacterized protein n=1 Tax=Brassicogethes aeneus TaxID=1431903 RepID=A0A9P0BCY5_BRAAE|nr:unnamed protein product [Brassicogethes aeneus]